MSDHGHVTAGWDIEGYIKQNLAIGLVAEIYSIEAHSCIPRNKVRCARFVFVFLIYYATSDLRQPANCNTIIDHSFLIHILILYEPKSGSSYLYSPMFSFLCLFVVKIVFGFVF